MNERFKSCKWYCFNEMEQYPFQDDMGAVDLLTCVQLTSIRDFDPLIHLKLKLLSSVKVKGLAVQLRVKLQSKPIFLTYRAKFR